MGVPPWAPLGRGRYLKVRRGAQRRDARTGMKILWVKAGKLLPVDTGGKIRSYNILRRLGAGNDLTLLSYYGGLRDVDFEKQIAKKLPGTVSVHTGGAGSSKLDYLRRPVRFAPYAGNKFTSPQ